MFFAEMFRGDNRLFLSLFIFRYLRLVINIVGYFLYRPTPVSKEPKYSPADCTIVIPTVEPEGPDFTECCHSVLSNRPGALLIVTVTDAKLQIAERTVNPMRAEFPATTISVTQISIANKRHQVAAGMRLVKTAFAVLVDDHVFWPSLNFLPTILAPFENDRVGVVGTNKRVRRQPTGLNIHSFFNFLGCTYLDRHNFEIRATNAIDGGVFVVSGRTSIWRTRILADEKLLAGFLNERFFFGRYGPLNADDDNFLTRWVVRDGWDIKIQFSDDAMIETTLGEYPRFLIWRRQPYSVYAVYISSLMNFALFWDVGLISSSLVWLAIWIFATKMVKLIPHFMLHPADVLLIPGYLAFAYFHSLMKLWALFTFYEIAWSGRNLAAIQNADETGRDVQRPNNVTIPTESQLIRNLKVHGVKIA
ncbi:nucleotide-diphospho-sugar transferase [Xylariomycetidae sp. FL0641]|nr:nucleotide-diphospho-sugar transferase [Xylariomycetidae sp. FL0641]